jgi:hypothetical protein
MTKAKQANWQCEVCGKNGTPDEHVLLTSGRLSRGTLQAHTFCPAHDPRRSAPMERAGDRD